MPEREDTAELIASGMSGWLQLQEALGLGALHGEDAAQLMITQILRSLSQWQGWRI